MRCALLSAILLLSALPASATESHAQSSWPRIRKARIQQLLPRAMEQAKVDAWVVICRENDNDPLAMHVGCENTGAQAAFLFFKQKEGVRALALSPAGEAKALKDVGPFDEVVSLPRGTDLFARVATALSEAKPQRIAVNSSRKLTVADGLSASQRERLQEALAPALRRRLVSSEELVCQPGSGG